MKKFSTFFLFVILIVALTFGVAYAIDKTRMDAGKPVIFSTWGKDYTPNSKNQETTPQSDSGAVNPDSSNTTDTNDEKELVEKEVTLYFADMDLVYLCGEKRIIKTEGGIARAVVEAIIAGPESDNYLRPVTSDVKVNSVSIPEGTTTCVVDLSKEFVLNNTGSASSETFAIYSIVNSLCQLPGIDNVKINIDGNENAIFGGHYDISVPIEPDMEIVSK